GEVMAIGRNQQESLQKALRGLEVGATGFDPKVNLDDADALTRIRYELKEAGSDRIWYLADAFRAGLSVDGVHNLTNIDRWFLVQIEELVRLEEKVAEVGFAGLDADFLRVLKRKGFSDARLAKLVGVSETELRKLRYRHEIFPVYKRVDTCAAEFATDTAYLYSTYDEECESNPTNRDKIMVLGGGPNRIGQGIEFDYCCVHASLALREDGYETIMVNCNPETVSTDYDTSDRLYFEPVTLEDVLEIVRVEQPKGVIVQYGGQTPLKLARALEAAGVPVIGTSPDAIDRAEDRERFQQAVNRLGLKQPKNATVTAMEQAVEQAKQLGYPLVVRPSYVLGGRAMEIVFDEVDLRRYFTTAVSVSNDAPVLLDCFLDDAIEVDVDAICDGQQVLIGGIMEHIEQAGVHSGDSACSLPAYTLSQEIQDVIRQQVEKLAFELCVRGLMNAQFAVKNNEVYLIEVNPRAARTVPFVSKAIGVPLAKIAARVMAGQSLAAQGVTREVIPPYYSVKEVVLPFNKFPGVDPLLGPEMRSTGEVMGVGNTFAEAFGKGLLGGNYKVPRQGRALLSVRHGDKKRVIDLAAKLLKLGFELDATHGTAVVLGEAGINPRLVNKVHEGRPHIQDRIKNGEYTYIINTAEGRQAIEDSKLLRRSALQYKVHYDTTLNGAFATAMAMAADPTASVISVQEMHQLVK
ncbi:MAG: carbamoyl-phosphate synthase large subunit, partial [Plesiomonas shigelloides]